MIYETISKEVENKIHEAILRLKEAGFKNTKKRQEILSLFACTDRYLSAQTVHEKLTENHPTMSYNTTYRNVYDFVEAGILESTEYNQEQHFRMNCLDHDHHHHHFICTNCGMAIPLETCPMNITLMTDDLKDVQINTHRFEIFGLCSICK
ncbi:transcriptional repressor [Aerococcaceae bacterium DSM 111021]|nr:transcriptional repressor [Aerococcaceae bacterium DSM 111021]